MELSTVFIKAARLQAVGHKLSTKRLESLSNWPPLLLQCSLLQHFRRRRGSRRRRIAPEVIPRHCCAIILHEDVSLRSPGIVRRICNNTGSHSASRAELGCHTPVGRGWHARNFQRCRSDCCGGCRQCCLDHRIKLTSCCLKIRDRLSSTAAHISTERHCRRCCIEAAAARDEIPAERFPRCPLRR